MEENENWRLHKQQQEILTQITTLNRGVEINKTLIETTDED